MKQDANSFVNSNGTAALRAVSDATPVHKPAFNWRDHAISAAALQAATFPQLKWAVPGLIPEGLTLLIAKAKKGKTWLMQDIVLAVTGQRYTLGSRKPETGDALYLALEDNNRRLRRRLAKLLPDDAKWPERLTLVTKWRRLNEGGIDDIRDWIKHANNPRMIVIDTLKMVRAAVKNKNAQLYDLDYESLQPLRELADEHGIAIVVLHHARKADAEDPIDMISGSGGLSAAANTILVITSGATGATLHVRGHDVEEVDLAVEFNKNTCRWSILGGAADVRQSDERKRIIEVLTQEAEPLTPSEIATIIGKNRKTVSELLRKLHRDGYVEKAKGTRGRYIPAENPPSNDSFSHWQDHHD